MYYSKFLNFFGFLDFFVKEILNFFDVKSVMSFFYDNFFLAKNEKK